MIDSTDMDDKEVSEIEKGGKYKMNRVAIVDGGIYVYDREGKLKKPQFTKRNIRNAIQIDQNNMYTISDKRFAWDNYKKKSDNDGAILNAGLFLYDYKQMLVSG
jgi:hypothetical protein